MAYYIYNIADGDVIVGVSTAEQVAPHIVTGRGVFYEEGDVRDYQYLTFDRDAGALVLDSEELAGVVRADRDALLRASDYTQLPDVPKDAAAWATYRQALRDLPTQEGFPETVTYPDRP